MRAYQVFKKILPLGNDLERNDIEFSTSNAPPRSKASIALEQKLAKTKDNISSAAYRRMNDYDLSALIKPMVSKKTGVCPTNGKLKMHEMFITFKSDILRHLPKTGERVLRGFNIAEFPGHFISAIIGLEKSNKFVYDWVAQSYLTREDETSSILKPDQKLFTEHRERWLINLDDGINGDLMDPKILKYYRDYFADDDKKVQLATADGGMSVGEDYNDQERIHFRLIAGEIYVAMSSLGRGGVFILKIFSTFENTTWGMIHILAYMFKKIIMHKPYTSRDRNDEKYVVCIGFRGLENGGDAAMATLLNIVKGPVGNLYPLVGATKAAERGVMSLVSRSRLYNTQFVKKEIARLNYLTRSIRSKKSNAGDRKRAAMYMAKYY